jgi:hypothetical protein
MIRHCLIPRRIVGQLGYVQTKLLRDESGEIMGRAGWFVSSLLSTQSSELKQGKHRVIVQVALEKHPQFPDVPLVAELMALMEPNDDESAS